MLAEVDRLISKKLLLDGRVPKRLKKRIIETLTNGAQGMFRWVAMSLETLQQIKFRADFENRLGRLPSKLSELYDIIHSEIIGSENDQTIKYGRVTAIKTLKWLLCAQRLLTVEELAAAIQLPSVETVDSPSGSDVSDVESSSGSDNSNVDSPSGSDDSNERDNETSRSVENDIIRLCRNLVVVDSKRTDSEQTDSEQTDSERSDFERSDSERSDSEQSVSEQSVSKQADSERKVLRFAHQSVREYLLTREEYNDIEQHALVVERCLEIYEVETSSNPAEPNLTRQNKILKPYARVYWPVHYKYLDDSGSQEWSRKLRNFMTRDSISSSPYMQWVVDAIDGFGIEDKSDPVGWISSSLDLEEEDPLANRLAYALAEPHTSLSMICAFGLSSVLNELDSLSVELNQKLKQNGRCRGDRVYEYTTPLTIASEQGHAQVVRKLLDKGATIDVSDESCMPPLLAAISHANESIVQMLLENGADIKAKCNINAWWVAYAVESEHVLKLLLERGADVNASDSYSNSALIEASEFGEELIVRFLLEQKADVNLMDRSGNIALHYATSNGHLSVVHILLEHGADINARDESDQTPLHRASEKGFESVVQILLESGADVNARDNQSKTSLHLASCSLRSNTSGAIYGIDVDVPDGLSEKALHRASKLGHELVVQLLLDHGADVHARDSCDGTPLHSASAWDYARIGGSVVRLLLEHGAKINAQRSSGCSPLHLAVQSGNERMVQLLLECGADVNARDNNARTPLHFVSDSLWASSDVVPLLLEHGAEINARDSSGWSLLHLAAKESKKPVVRVLLDHAADINALENNGWTPLDLARRYNKNKMVRLLLQHGATENAKASEKASKKTVGDPTSTEKEENQSGEGDEDRGEDRSGETKVNVSEAKIDEADVRDNIHEA